MTVVMTTSGPVRGRSTATATVFRGVPYAAAPHGRLRFAAPRPHPPWTDIRDATEPGPTAPQPARDAFGALDMSPLFGPGWRRGDDYLTVDVWAPAEPGPPVPVMVFVPGGGFVAGSAGAPLYDGGTFARDGVLLIAVNYRLGIPGFLHLPDAPDNRGLLDVLAALRWVHGNAARFGGDPGTVTLVGQSAGAGIVGGVLADPASRGLIRRAILQSASGVFHPEQAKLVTAAIGRELRFDPSARTLAGCTDADLVDVASRLAGLDLRTPGRPDPLGGISRFGLVRREPPAVAVSRGASRDVDLLAGVNAEEGSLYLAPLGLLATTTEADLRDTAARLHDRPDELIAAYRASRPDATLAELRIALLGEGVFGAPTRAMAAAHGITHEYEFTWRSDAVDGQLGAAHATELPFVFDVAGRAALHGRHGLLGPATAPAGLAARMHAAWIRFAATGDPGWPASRPGHRIVQRIGTQWQLVHDPHPRETAAWR
jgi:para-nitrobenzyl esterase